MEAIEWRIVIELAEVHVQFFQLRAIGRMGARLICKLSGALNSATNIRPQGCDSRPRPPIKRGVCQDPQQLEIFSNKMANKGGEFSMSTKSQGGISIALFNFGPKIKDD